MLVEIAIADAYGAGFEYVKQGIVEERNDLKCYYQHPKHLSIKPGCYTDDTQMALGISELLISGTPWTPKNLADKFVVGFRRDKRQGYAGGFYHLLLGTDNGKQLLERIRPQSEKSGGAMRAMPIGVLPSVPQVIEYATIQAAITHNTENGLAAAVGSALLTHFAIYQLDSKRHAHRFLHEFLPGKFRIPWRGKTSGQGVVIVSAALTAFQRNDTLSGLLRDCVDFCGDVDTVAAIAMAAGACSAEYENDLPEHLYENLENGAFGAGYLEKIDDKLMTLKRP